MIYNRKILFMILGLGLLITLIITTDFSEVVKTLGSLRPIQIIVLIILQALTIFLLSFQWLMISKQLGLNLSFKRIYEMNMVGTFFESVTPAVKTGGEAYKVYYLKTKGQSLPNGSALLSLQKLFSMTAFIIMAGFLFAYFFVFGITQTLPKGISIAYFLVIGLIGGILGLGLLFLKSVNLPKKVQDFQTDFKQTLKAFGKQKHRFLYHCLFGMIIWGLYAYKTYYLVQSFNLDVSYLSSALATYSAYIVALLPFTPGGLGTFEGTFTMVMHQFGIASATALSIVITLRLFTFWLQLLISAIYLFFQQGRFKGVQHDG